MQEGYIAWLKSKGVGRMIEDIFFNTHNRNAGNIYYFDDQKTANGMVDYQANLDLQMNFVKLISPNASDLSEFYTGTSVKEELQKGMAIRNTVHGLIPCVYISPKVQEKLYEAYINEVQPQKTSESIDAELQAIKDAKAQVLGVQNSVPEEYTQNGRAPKSFDQLGYMAKLLRNKASGWSAPQAVEAITTAASVYKATHFDLMSDTEKAKFDDVQRHLLGKTQDGKYTHGLLEDARTVESIAIAYRTPYDANTFLYPKVIRDNTQDLLYGGEHVSMKILRMRTNTPYTPHEKPRFFPDRDGNSETNTIALHAGGMEGHSAMRVLRKIEDPQKVGGHQYVYTKIDAGGGVEQDTSGQKVPIITTEITPQVKRNFFGGITPLTDTEKAQLNNPALKDDPKVQALHRNAMKATLEELIKTERKLELIPAAPVINHGEGKNATAATQTRWQRLEDYRKQLRGEHVIEQISLPTQREGNCTVYSTALCQAALLAMKNGQATLDRTGLNLGMDMMQSAKTSKHHNVILELSQRERGLEAMKAKISEKNMSTLLTTAALSGMLIAGQDPLLYAFKQKIPLDGMPAVEWAAANKLNIDGKDPMVFAMDNKLKMAHMHPIEWAYAMNHNAPKEQQIKIEGKNVTTWALENPDKSRINGMPFVEYLGKFRLERKEELVKNVAEDGRNIQLIILDNVVRTGAVSSIMADLYMDINRSITPNLKDRHEVEVATSIKADRGIMALDRESSFGKMLYSNSPEAVAKAMLDAPESTKKMLQTLSNDNALAMMNCCTLDVMAKVIQVGQAMEALENKQDKKSSIVDKIVNFFKGAQKELSHNPAIYAGFADLSRTMSIVEANKKIDLTTDLDKTSAQEKKVASWVEKVGGKREERAKTQAPGASFTP